MSRKFLLALTVFLLLSAVAFTYSQSYEMKWWSIDGGGAKSSGGSYAITGAIGQPDTGEAMSSGPYNLDGGFWQATTSRLPPENPIVLLPLLMR